MMAKKRSIQKQSLQKPASHTVPKTVSWGSLDSNEQLSVVCNLFTKCKKVSEIAKYVNEKYHAGLKREAIYPLLMKAVKKKWLRYIPPQEQQLEQDLKIKHNWLSGVRVVHSSQFSDIASCGAEMLLDLLKNYRHPSKKEIHIGFAGGHAMRILASHFAKLLADSETPFQKKLVLHALVAGFNVYEPTTDPNTFFSLFHSDEPHGIQFDFVGLHAPPLVESKEYPKLIKAHGFKESKKEAENIDIIVTSATCWNDEHSTFRKYMNESPGCLNTLKREKCVGDMLWHPLGETKPVEARTKIRAMTLYDLNDLSDFVKKDKNVLLVLGPCAYCNQTKTSVLKAILDQDNQLITHLVVDSRSVRKITKG